MPDDTERSSIRECPECGNDGHQAWVLGHWYCPRCDLEYDDSGEPTELQAMAQDRGNVGENGSEGRYGMTDDEIEYTDEAKRRIEEAREAYENGETAPIGELFKELGVDPDGLDTEEGDADEQ